jgi:hypothetical protein
MESGPAIFTGVVFALLGAALLGWTAVRVRGREPVAYGVHRIMATTAASVIGLALVTLGAWCLSLL